MIASDAKSFVLLFAPHRALKGAVEAGQRNFVVAAEILITPRHGRQPVIT
jgi:hypothetical protein